MKMFDAKSDLSWMNPEEVVTMDYKMFDFSGTKMWIGVLETTNPSFALERKEELVDAMNAIKQREWFEYLLLCVVDILEEENIAIIASEKEAQLVTEAFETTVVEWCAKLWARVSRKKQISPVIDGWFAK